MIKKLFWAILISSVSFAQESTTSFVKAPTTTPAIPFEYQGVARGHTESSTTSLDLSVTIPENCNYVVGCMGFESIWGELDSLTIPLAVELKGTQIVQLATGGSNNGIDAWGIKGNIPSGAQTIHFKWANAGTMLGSATIMFFSGVNQTTPFKSTSSGSGSPSSVSTAITCDEGDIMVAFEFVNFRTISGTGNTTVLTPYESTDDYARHYGCYEVAGGVDHTISWDLSSANPESHVAFALQPEP